MATASSKTRQLLFTAIIVIVGRANGKDVQGNIRLTDGSSVEAGTVEIFYDNQWNKVCDDDWDLTDASVVCHQLGYPRASDYYRRANFSPGSGEVHIIIPRLSCTGSETRLLDCSHGDVYNASCDSAQNIAVECELQHAQNVPGTYFRSGTGLIVMSDALCHDYVDILLFCDYFSWPDDSRSCSHDNDVTDTCSQDIGLSNGTVAGLSIGCGTTVFVLIICCVCCRPSSETQEQTSREDEADRRQSGIGDRAHIYYTPVGQGSTDTDRHTVHYNHAQQTVTVEPLASQAKASPPTYIDVIEQPSKYAPVAGGMHFESYLSDPYPPPNQQYPSPSPSPSTAPYPPPSQRQFTAPYPLPIQAIATYPPPSQSQFNASYPLPMQSRATATIPPASPRQSSVPYPPPSQSWSTVPDPPPSHARTTQPDENALSQVYKPLLQTEL